jgi:hypothetical protein
MLYKMFEDVLTFSFMDIVQVQYVRYGLSLRIKGKA